MDDMACSYEQTLPVVDGYVKYNIAALPVNNTMLVKQIFLFGRRRFRS
jgi:hypothetical protein